MAAVRRAAACLQIQPLLSWDEAHTRGPRHYPVQLLRRNGQAPRIALLCTVGERPLVEMASMGTDVKTKMRT
jgi:hypothetical protein